MKKNTILLLILFVALGGAAFYFLKNKDLKNSRSDAWDMQFSIPEARTLVTKIRMTDRTGKQAILEKTKGSWMINGRYKARQSSADLLVETIRRVTVKYIPSNAAVPRMMESLASLGIRVDMFNGDEIIKTWYVGGVTPDDRGTYFLMEGSKQPYVAHIPSEESELRPRFILIEEEWRDRTVFEEKPEEIAAISIEYPQYQAFSFNLTKVEKGEYQVTPFYPNQPVIKKTLARGKAESYLLMYEKLVAEGFENTNYRRDSVLSLVPFASVTVKKTDGTSKNVRFYPMYARDIDGNFILPSSPSPFMGGIERYFAYKEPEKDFFLTQHVVMGKLFANYPWFFESQTAGGVKN
jgi:Domain of unknown function (DUF4340)